ncbi:MAG: hypothetical protein M3R46_11755 [Actinomycetota bacterium]|nr:hypothetical protein [Actinomycetota bacterium]
MNQQPTRCLSGDEITALMFAARRQLTRWANRRDLQPRELVQRTALIRAVRVLEDSAFNDSCELRATPSG